MLNILIVKLSAIGDVIHCLPVAAELKASLPDARICWLVEAGSADLLQNNPCVDEVIVFQSKGWAKKANNPGNWFSIASEAQTFFGNLKSRKFDAVLEMQGLLKSSLVAYASGAPIRIGFADTREFADKFLTHKVNVGDYFGHYVPVVELNLKIAHALIRLLGHEPKAKKPEFHLPPPGVAQVEKVERLLAPLLVSSGGTGVDTSAGGQKTQEDIQNYVSSAEPVTNSELSASELYIKKRKIVCAIIPGTTWVTKIWPEDKWVELCRLLSEKLHFQLVLIGSKAEKKINSRLAQSLETSGQTQFVDLTGETSLFELVSVFSRCDVVVGGDTGPLHLAAAVGKPKILGIYGSTPAKRNGPYGDQCVSIALKKWCQPCYSKTCALKTVECLTDLSTQTIYDAVCNLMSETKSHV